MSPATSSTNTIIQFASPRPHLRREIRLRMTCRTRTRLPLLLLPFILPRQTPALRIRRRRPVLRGTLLMHTRPDLLHRSAFGCRGGVRDAFGCARLNFWVGGDVGFEGGHFGFGELALFFETGFAAAFVTVPEDEEEDCVGVLVVDMCTG